MGGDEGAEAHDRDGPRAFLLAIGAVIGASVMLTHSVEPYTVVTLEKPSLRIKSPDSRDKDLPYQI